MNGDDEYSLTAPPPPAAACRRTEEGAAAARRGVDAAVQVELDVVEHHESRDTQQPAAARGSHEGEG